MTWCYLPDAACPSAQAAADLTWALALPSRALPPPATSRSKTTPASASSQDSAPDICTRPRSGTTSRPSGRSLGAGTLTPCSQDIHVLRSALRESASGTKTPGTYGPTSAGSSASYSPDGAFSRMLPGTFPSGSTPCCETYEKWATRLRLAYSRRSKQARRMKGNGCSLWPTVISQDAKQSGHAATGTGQAEKLAFAVATWPTPMAGTPAQNGNNAAGNKDFTRRAEELAAGLWKTPDVPNGGRSMPDGTTETGLTPDGKKLTVGLENQTRMWGTPRGSDGEKGGPNMSFGAGGTPLPTMAAHWPTPASRDQKGENGAAHMTNGTGRLHLDQLPNFVAHCFTPPAQRTWTNGVPSSIWRPISRRLLRSAMSSMSPTSQRRWLRRGAWRKRRLNPLFVEWLQAWPKGHALCASSEMAFTLWQRDMRGALSALPMDYGPWTWVEPVPTKAPEQMSLL